jgi:hypothetical protein
MATLENEGICLNSCSFLFPTPSFPSPHDFGSQRRHLNLEIDVFSPISEAYTGTYGRLPSVIGIKAYNKKFRRGVDSIPVLTPTPTTSCRLHVTELLVLLVLLWSFEFLSVSYFILATTPRLVLCYTALRQIY